MMEKKHVMVIKMEGYGFLAEGATVGVWKWSDVACFPIAAVSLLVSCKSCYTKTSMINLISQEME